MSILNYLNKLRASDEKTKHRSALIIAIILSAIVLLFLFFIFKDRLLNIGHNKEAVVEEIKVENKNEEEKLESPMTSFINFFKETGNQFSSIKSSLSGVFNNATTSTSSDR